MIRKCKHCNNDHDFKYNTQKYCSKKCSLMDNTVKRKDGCWFYKKYIAHQYPSIKWFNKNIRASRVSYEVFKGPIGDKLVLHTCDKSKCVNPDHLYLGTHKDNAYDAKVRGRFSRGQFSHLSIYTDRQVWHMRNLRKEGYTYQQLLEIFNCSTSYIYEVLNNKMRTQT